MKMSELFHACAYDVKYEQVGESVNYAFIPKGSTLYIYFQGSNSIWDWVRNFMFGKRPYKDMAIPYRVHRGFLEAWKEVEDIVIEKINEKCKNGNFKWKKVIIVGYSHGAALAGLCHECVWFNRQDLKDGGLLTYAFEAPRFYAGYKVKKELVERWSNFFVIRTNEDIVTHCPPAIFSYCHVGNMLKVIGDKSLCPRKWMPGCIKSHYPEVVYDALVKFEDKKEEIEG